MIWINTQGLGEGTTAKGVVEKGVRLTQLSCIMGLSKPTELYTPE